MAGSKPKVSTEEMLALREQGLTNKEIGDKLGLNRLTVQKRIGPQPAELTLKNRANGRKRARKALMCDKPEQLTFAPPEEKPVEPSLPVKKEPKGAATTPTKSTKPAVVETELFKFAYTPSICEQLNLLSLLADPEPWAFTDPADNKPTNPETTILELYLNETFQDRAVEYNTCAPEDLDKCILIRDNFCCFHTGLYTRNFKDIYACYGPNRNLTSPRPWYFIGFKEDIAPELRGVHPLPEHRRQTMPPFNPSLPLRVNTNHIFRNPKTFERLPAYVRTYWNPQMLLETAMEFGRRKSLIDPSFTISCPRISQPCYLMPLYILQPDKPDIVAVIEPMNGYNHVKTVLTLKQAYLYARVQARPTADWLRALVEPNGTG